MTLEEIERDKLHTSFSELLATEAGRRVIYWTLEQCAIYRDAYTGDDAATNYTLGMQASGRKLISEIDAINPRFYPQLLLDISELRDRDRAAAEATNQPENDDDD
ncbi:MAG: hypothetical protein ACRCSX_09805 [Allorhizobium sp.]